VALYLVKIMVKRAFDAKEIKKDGQVLAWCRNKESGIILLRKFLGAWDKEKH